MKHTLKEIKGLYDDMKRKKKYQEKFGFKILDVDFEAIFLIDRVPFELLIGVKKYQFAFILQLIQVKNGFETELPDKIYFRICKILDLSWDKNHFSSFRFFQYLDNSAPKLCSKKSVEPHEVAYYKKKDIPESQKIYFCGWNDHLADGRKARNIEKTRKLLGDAVADFCQKNNISSMWTDIQKDRTEYKDPSGFERYFLDD